MWRRQSPGDNGQTRGVLAGVRIWVSDTRYCCTAARCRIALGEESELQQNKKDAKNQIQELVRKGVLQQGDGEDVSSELGFFAPQSTSEPQFEETKVFPLRVLKFASYCLGNARIFRTGPKQNAACVWLSVQTLFVFSVIASAHGACKRNGLTCGRASSLVC